MWRNNIIKHGTKFHKTEATVSKYLEMCSPPTRDNAERIPCSGNMYPEDRCRLSNICYNLFSSNFIPNSMPHPIFSSHNSTLTTHFLLFQSYVPLVFHTHDSYAKDVNWNVCKIYKNFNQPTNHPVSASKPISNIKRYVVFGPLTACSSEMLLAPTKLHGVIFQNNTI